MNNNSNSGKTTICTTESLALRGTSGMGQPSGTSRLGCRRCRCTRNGQLRPTTWMCGRLRWMRQLSGVHPCRRSL
eukprot:6334271-Lingulodinium_polyedra.AAC.1